MYLQLRDIAEAPRRQGPEMAYEGQDLVADVDLGRPAGGGLKYNG